MRIPDAKSEAQGPISASGRYGLLVTPHHSLWAAVDAARRTGYITRGGEAIVHSTIQQWRYALPTIEALENMLKKEPDDPFLHFGLAMQLAKERRQEDSLARFDQVIRLDPYYTAAYHQKGIALIGLSRTEAAREVLHQGIEAAQHIGNAHAEKEMIELLASIT